MTVDRIAVVSGAARGIGRAIADRLVADGYRVIGLDLSFDDAPDDREQVVGDVGDDATWAQLVATHELSRRGVHLLVNNAYLLIAKPIHELSIDEWSRQMAVNLDALHRSARHIIPCMVEGSSIIAVSSVHALIGVSAYPAYAAAKGASVALARQMAVEYGPKIRVNAVLPGPIRTAAWDRIPVEAHEKTAAGTAMKRLGSPNEVAAAVAFLASHDASYITGTSLLVDGGYTALKSEE